MARRCRVFGASSTDRSRSRCVVAADQSRSGRREAVSARRAGRRRGCGHRHRGAATRSHDLWVPRNVSRLLTRAFVVVRARRPPVRRDPRLQQKGPADPLTTCSAHEDRARCDRDLEEATDPNRPQQRRTALNVARVLEQNLTPFRGPKTSAPDLLQTRTSDRPMWTLTRSIKIANNWHRRRSGRHPDA